MRTLVIDTATEACSVALFDNNLLIARQHDIVGRGHAEHLVRIIASLPDKGRAERIAVDVGPGSFTGVRIGLAAARALAFAWKARLTGYSALPMIATAAHKRVDVNTDIMVAITGGHGELFWQRFAGNMLTPLGPLASTPIDTLAALATDDKIYGTGAQVLIAARGSGEAVPLHPDAGDYMALPALFSQLPPSPLYGRGADAKPMT
ncbi:MAG: tRNA (adenosine(37)-N6)-threonylcarbamoyltransferase complex dimerization subunit type 1 TsaB [Alphaproteobacteria bacterium]|nr:tRNA (adenosine(37)-N6)-threonylcarbamoyltransferase complex dimerization subunit type 1 TsaB [Alphaproteobacteria bacterium]